MRNSPLVLSLEALLLIPLVAAALRVSPGRVMRRMRFRGRAGLPVPPALAGLVASAIDRAASWLPGRAATCLARALAAHLMLARRGATASVRIGVLKTRTGITAHAWVDAGAVEIGVNSDSAGFMTLPVH